MSAVIYQFPAGGRAALGDRILRKEKSSAQQSAPPAITACGSAWYHDEAIKEETLPKQ